MTVRIDFPAEMESRLVAQAQAAGQDVASFVQQIVAERLSDDMAATRRAVPHDEFISRLQRIIMRHPGSKGRMDDSRESIYGGRGE